MECINNEENFPFICSYFVVPYGQLPIQLQNHIKETRCIPNRRNTNRNKNDQNGDYSERNATTSAKPRDTRYYSLNLDRANIKLVDDHQQFNQMLSYLVRQHMVAFDAEWKPIGSAAASKVALIQFATSECVFLLDAVTINIDIDTWNRLAIDVFNNCEILKIGEFFFGEF